MTALGYYSKQGQPWMSWKHVRGLHTLYVTASDWTSLESCVCFAELCSLSNDADTDTGRDAVPPPLTTGFVNVDHCFSLSAASTLDESWLLTETHRSQEN